jgi:light-independent protochlorophyllide reductase subunit B
MELTVWTYEGPPHMGAIRIAASMKAVHCVLHAPQGDTYADLLFTMIARSAQRPPVSYTTFQARDLGADTAELVKTRIQESYDRFQPQALLVGEACTAELLQDQPGSLASGMGLPIPIIPLELNAFSRKENWGASETFHQLVRTLLRGQTNTKSENNQPDHRNRHLRANILGPTALGFRCRDDVEEVTKILTSLGIDINLIAPAGASPQDLLRIPDADFNLCLYPEIAYSTCVWLERFLKQPWIKTVPIGVGATRDFIAEIAALTGLDATPTLDHFRTRLPWYSRSIDSTYLTGKRVFLFGDASHVQAAARVASEELGFQIVGVGTYLREFAREIRALADTYNVEPLITDNYLQVEERIAQLQPELVLGTQMERHIAKRLGIPCAIISAPIHVQDFPARYAPQMGFEGANVLFDTWVQPLMMGLEEHLLTMFRGDEEFHDRDHPTAAPQNASTPSPTETAPNTLSWHPDAEKELGKIPFFVRGKARRNTENYARERNIQQITVETLYEAKAHFGR